MSDTSSIEWTDATWNPVTGCDRVSPGCDHCYALTLASRLKAMGQARYQNDGDPRSSGPGFGVTLQRDLLDLPRSWRKPRRVFVNSMSDLFHPQVPTEFIWEVFEVMRATPQHTYQVLTKRSPRMSSFFYQQLASQPLPNVWLGVSIEDQERAGQRIRNLLETPAAVRFLSCEPLLGSLDLTNIQVPKHNAVIDCLAGDVKTPAGEIYAACPSAVDWVIVGGESGPDARPMQADWVRSLRDQTKANGRAFFFKQWGGRTPKAGGRELDGRVWDEMPTTTGGETDGGNGPSG